MGGAELFESAKWAHVRRILPVLGVALLAGCETWSTFEVLAAAPAGEDVMIAVDTRRHTQSFYTGVRESDIEQHLLTFAYDSPSHDTDAANGVEARLVSAVKLAPSKFRRSSQYLILDPANHHVVRLSLDDLVTSPNGRFLWRAKVELLAPDKQGKQWGVVREWGPAAFLISQTGRSLVLIEKDKATAIDLAGGGQEVHVPGLNALVDQLTGGRQFTMGGVVDSLYEGAQFWLTDDFDFVDFNLYFAIDIQTSTVTRLPRRPGSMRLAARDDAGRALIVDSLAQGRGATIADTVGAILYGPTDVGGVGPRTVFPSAGWDVDSRQIAFYPGDYLLFSDSGPMPVPMAFSVWRYGTDGAVVTGTIGLDKLIVKDGNRYRLRVGGKGE